MPSFVHLISFVLLLHFHQALGVGHEPLSAICPTTRNYTGNDAFGNNLRQLLFLLATQAPRAAGFAAASVGEGYGMVSGLALCRGDVQGSACTTCLRTAEARFRDLCPHGKEAYLWFDECMLKYSDDMHVVGNVDYEHKFYMWNTGYVSDPATFNGKVAYLLEQLKEKAYASPLLFATGEMGVAAMPAQKLYGLVQCTRDLTSSDCKRCLENAIRELPSCCGGRPGGRVVGASCNFIYEMYPFYGGA